MGKIILHIFLWLLEHSVEILEPFLKLIKLRNYINRLKKQVFLYFDSDFLLNQPTSLIKDIEDFLKSLGIKVITLKDSSAFLKEQSKIEDCFKKTFCAVIIATPHKFSSYYDGKKYITPPDQKVINVTGQALSRFKKKVILIYEGDVKWEIPESNKKPFQFDGKNYPILYSAIVRELREFKVIK